MADLLAERTDLAHVADVVAVGRYAAELVDIDVDAASAGAGRGYGMSDRALAVRLEELVVDAAPVSARLEYGGAVAAQLTGPLEAFGRVLDADPSILAVSADARAAARQISHLIGARGLGDMKVVVPRIPLSPGLQDQVAQLASLLDAVMREARVPGVPVATTRTPMPSSSRTAPRRGQERPQGSAAPR